MESLQSFSAITEGPADDQSDVSSVVDTAHAVFVVSQVDWVNEELFVFVVLNGNFSVHLA